MRAVLRWFKKIPKEERSDILWNPVVWGPAAMVGTGIIVYDEMSPNYCDHWMDHEMAPLNIYLFIGFAPLVVPPYIIARTARKFFD